MTDECPTALSSDNSIDSPNQHRLALAVGIGLTVLTWIVYWQVRHFDFVNLDDGIYVTDNPFISTGLSRENVVWAFTTSATSNWHPLTWLSLMLDVQLFGLNSGALHLTNLLFHTANVLLLFVVLRLLTGSLWRSALVSALFAIHPLHVESVAWVSERKDVLSIFLGLMAIACYARYAKTQYPKAQFAKTDSRKWLWACGVLWTCSLMAKQMLVTLPFVLLLLDYWPLDRFHGPDGKIDVRHLVIEKLPLFAVTVIFCIIAFVVQHRSGAVKDLDSFSLSSRMANALVVYVLYLAKTIWPQHLAAFYPHPKDAIPVWQILGTASLLAAVSCIVFRSSRRHPGCLVGWLWYLGTLVPVIGLVQIGAQQMADRYTYFPLVGIFIAFAWMLPAPALAGRWGAGFVATAAGVAVAVLAFVAWRQAGTWRDSERLFSNAVAVTRGNAFAESNLGLAVFLKGRHDEAYRHFQQALEIDPQCVSALNNLGTLMSSQGQPEQALEFHRRALAIDPLDNSTLGSIGRILFELGRTDEALEQFEQAIRIFPKDFYAHDSRGNIFRATGRPTEALEEFTIAAQIDPKSALAYNNMGVVLAQLGQADKAVASYRRAIRLDPRFAPAHANLGNVLHGLEDFDGALQHFQRAYELDPSNDAVKQNLAAEYVNVGTQRVSGRMVILAIDDFQSAVDLIPGHVDANYRLARALAENRQFQKAADRFEKTLALNAEIPEVHFDYGIVLRELGRRDKALEQVQEALRLRPDSQAAKNVYEQWLQDK